MGNLLSYSGLTTKIRKMQSNLLTDEEYRELAEITTVPLAVSYLKQKPAYSQIWSSLNESQLHRGQLEKLLINSVYHDFTSIYHFADREQRKFLDLYFKRYEISILKNCLNNIFDHRIVDLDLTIFKSFLGRYSCLNIDILSTSSSVEEFIKNLAGTEYERPLKSLKQIQEPTLFDYEMTLDLYYFTYIWKIKDKLFAKKDLQHLTITYGYKFDLLNLQWIYRSRTYYRMSSADIYALLIPVNYKLSKKEIAALVEAENHVSFHNLLRDTYYGRKFEQLHSNTLEDVYNNIMKQILSVTAKRDPYSIAVIYRYLYFKDHEIRRLTVALECIRYGMAPEEILTHIFKF